MFLLPTITKAAHRLPLLVDNGRVWSLAELATAVAELAGELRTNQKTLAFCFCRNDASTVISYLGAVEAGCATLLLDANLTEEFQADLVQRYRPEWLIGAKDAIRTSGSEDFSPVDTRLGVRLHRRRADFSDMPPHTELSLLLSTSGSTGSPKLVRLRRASVEHNARMIAKALELDEHERPITSLPLHYSYGLSVLNSHLAQRACLVLTDEPLTSKSFWDIFRRERCTSMAGVPYTYQILRRLELDKLGLPSLSTLTQAGGKLDVNLVKHFSDIMSRRGGRFFVMYGQTEATARIAVLPASLVSSKPEAAGRVLCEGELRIEANGVALPPGQIGEVTYRGVNVMMGYAENREDLMRGDELGGELRTGDLGYLDEEGVLFITGRSKRIAKVFGLRINLEEVEAMLRVHGDTAVLGATDQLIIYCEYGDEEFFSACRRMVAEKLKIHHQAFVFKRVELLPRNANGKIDYQRLQREV